MSFDYRVSVIVPICNQEPYLKAAVNSLIRQTIEPEEIEILLINDGSTDASPTICDEFAEHYSNIRVIHKANGGLSDARNCGINNAQGKYLMFLDGDDTLRKDTVEAVVDFFDNHYDEVDLVTYPSVSLKNGRPTSPHYRYQTLKQSGIYDLRKWENIFAAVTRIEVCVKNLAEDNVLFSSDRTFRHEDEKYCTDVILNKLKIGFVNEGAYFYERQPEGLQNTYFHAFYIFENTMAFWEEEFGRFESKVPQYLQALFVSDCAWKTQSNILLPYHYDKQHFQEAVDRIKSLLNRVDVEVISAHPALNHFQRAYLLQLGGRNVSCLAGPSHLALTADRKLVYSRSKVEIILLKTIATSDALIIKGFLKSPCFQFTEKPNLYARLNSESQFSTEAVKLEKSSWSYNSAKIETNLFWGFTYEVKINSIVNQALLSFEVDYMGMRHETNYYFMPKAIFSLKAPKRLVIYRDNFEIKFVNNVFAIRQLDSEEIRKRRNSNEKQLDIPLAAKYARMAARSISQRHRIWLYHDCHGVEKNNAYYQFVHDIKMNDGIDRYYVVNDNLKQVEHLFSKHELQNVIRFKSKRHKLLFLSAERIITAYVETTNWQPFGKKAMRYYQDIVNAKVTYLQHGVLHAHQPWKYSMDRLLIDSEVVSTDFEIQNLCKNYCFHQSDLIPAGMPRYDYLNQNEKSDKRILFAPSWRKYLVRQKKDGQWLGIKNVFAKSLFFKELSALLNSAELNRLLEEHDYTLELKLHPILSELYRDYFQFDSRRIQLAPESVNESKYRIFITDFSSYRFDFVYLKRTIMYFFPDYELFKSGMCDYRETDLPLDGTFGNMTTTANEAISELRSILKRDGNPEEKYRQQMDGFFLHDDNSQCNRIYSALISNSTSLAHL